MKILTGSLRGQKIFNHKVSETLRPTSDKVRKAIFDALQGAVEEKNILDLFGGTGALGIEALSLGAGAVTIVEMDRLRSLKIEENLKRLGLSGKANVLTDDVFKALPRLERSNTYFDVIFLDPPYEKNLAQRTLEALGASRLAGPDTIVVAECHRRETLPKTAGRLQSLKAKTYGDTQVIFYKVIA